MGVKEEFLRRLMDEKKVSQADISRMTDIPPGTISSILRSEDGVEKTSYSNVRKICEALGLAVDDLERVGPDGKLPEEVVAEASVGEPVLPEAPDMGNPESGIQEAAEDESPFTQDETGPVENPEPFPELEPEIPGFDPGGFSGYDPDAEGLLEVRQYFVVRRLSACSEEDTGRMVSVIPSVNKVEKNGLYAVRLPGLGVPVLRKIWRMDDGLLLLMADRFDETPRIIRPGTEGFSVLGRVVEEDRAEGLPY